MSFREWCGFGWWCVAAGYGVLSGSPVPAPASGAAQTGVPAPAGRVVEAAVPGLVRRDLYTVALTLPDKRMGHDVEVGA